MGRGGIAKTVEFVRLGYHDVSLDFKVDVIDFDEFSQCVRAIGGYNEFDPETVIQALKSIFPEVRSVVVGREHSVCLYVHLPYWDNQRVANHGKTAADIPNNHLLSERELDELGARVITCFNSAEADEVGYADSTNGDSYHGKREMRTLIRAWWD